MNYRILAKFLGYISAGTGLFMLTSLVWVFYYHEYDQLQPLLESVAVCLALGAGLVVLGRRAEPDVHQREALALVGFTWIIVAGLGALPFIFSGMLGPVDAYFESMSGFTTTGSSVLQNIDGQPKCMLFWRALTHWLGGLGIVILFITTLPYLGAGGKHLFLRESTGPDPRGIHPRVKDTVRALYKIYIGLTILGIVALMVAGMDLWDASCHTFAALATGGFSTRQASVAYYHSLPIEIVLIVQMLAGGTNFGLYAELLRGNWREFVKDTEFRVYMGIFVVSTLLCTFNLMGAGFTVRAYDDVALRTTMAAQTLDASGTAPGEPVGVNLPRTRYPFGPALRNASFQVSTCMTDTGFATDNFDLWPYMSRVILLVVTILGGCAGSTSGGIKTIRVIILMKATYFWMERAFRPRTVRAVRINGNVIDEEMQSRVHSFFVIYIVWLTFAWLVMSAFGLPLDSALSASIATMNNCGPGLEFVGPITDFHLVPTLGKVFLSNMLVGRLEFLSILVFVMPAFWRKY